MKRRWFFCLMTFLWVLALVLTSSWDLKISDTLRSHPSWFGQFINDWGGWPGWIVLAIALCATATKFRPIPRSLARLILIQGLFQGLLVTHLLKQLWGRVRPCDLTPAHIRYTPFFHPMGPGGGESFPSGHVAAVMMLAPIPFFLARRGYHRSAIGSAVLVISLWLAVAFGRIQYGAHFPTDCLFSMGFGVLFAWAAGDYYDYCDPAS